MIARGRGVGLPVLAATTSAPVASDLADMVNVVVAHRIQEYAALGIEEFVLSGYPHLEEAYWFGEGVLPELRRRTA